MRELLFYVADKNAAFSLRGFFGREQFHRSASCAEFQFDIDQDIKVAVGKNDPGLYSHAVDILRPFHLEYRRVVIVMDEEWGGTPGQAAIKTRLHEHMQNAGWTSDFCCAVVACPEIDNWLWTNTDHTAKALGWDTIQELREGLKLPDQPKPPRPKETAEQALRVKRKPRSSDLYKQVAQGVSLRHCQDPAVQELLEKLRQWFPTEGV
jgi:hypothetical protein